MFADEALIEHEKKQDAKDKVTRSDDVIALCVKEKMIGVALIKRANNEHRKLLTTIRDQHVLRIDVYSNSCTKRTSYWKTTAPPIKTNETTTPGGEVEDHQEEEYSWEGGSVHGEEEIEEEDTRALFNSLRITRSCQDLTVGSRLERHATSVINLGI